MRWRPVPERKLSRRARLGGIALAPFAALGGWIAATGPAWLADGTLAGPDAPNVVVVLTDDQTVDSLRSMHLTRDLLVRPGTTFTDAVVSFPLCCPARASLLTGRYAHNHGVLGNVAPEGGYTALDESETLAIWLQRAGYQTSHVGKYLNGYGSVAPPVTPPGWDAWFGLDDPTTYRYRDYRAWVDGELRSFQGEGEYQTDVLADRAVAEIDRMAPADDPFYLQVWFTAPHGGSDGLGRAAPPPALRHHGEAAPATLSPPPAVNEGDVTDKPDHVRSRPPLSWIDAADATVAHQARLEALMAVDDAVARIVHTLEVAGELDRTLIVFTSDNGFLMGEHRILFDKIAPYEESIRVPLVVRGPGFPAGRRVDHPVVNLDVAATVLALTGADAPWPLDGRPLSMALDAPDDGDRAVLLENGARHPSIPTYEGVRTRRYTYVEYHSGERELYDRDTDPHQLSNRAGVEGWGDVERRLAETLERLRHCAGPSCRVD